MPAHQPMPAHASPGNGPQHWNCWKLQKAWATDSNSFKSVQSWRWHDAQCGHRRKKENSHSAFALAGPYPVFCSLSHACWNMLEPNHGQAMAILSFRRLQGSTSTWAEGILQAPCRWQSSRLEWSRLVAWKLHSLTNRIRHSRKVNQSLLQKIPKVSTSALFWGVLNYNAWFQWVALPQYARFWGDLAGSRQPVMINPHELPSGKLT